MVSQIETRHLIFPNLYFTKITTLEIKLIALINVISQIHYTNTIYFVEMIIKIYK